jgi:bifunctional non-homologous end joining protein LigD
VVAHAHRETARPVVAGVGITHPDRVLYPDAGVTKLELALHYEAMADRILPHIVGRPLSIVRCPEGLDRAAVAQGIHQTMPGPRETKCFFQKHTSRTLGEGVRTVRVPEKNGMADYLAIDDVKGLVTLVQFGTLEIHPWGSLAEAPDRPDRMFFDLDPGPSTEWQAVVEGARAIRQILDGVELRSFVKTTGGKGLHVVVPLRAESSWEEVKAFSAGVAARLVDREPDKYVLTMAKRVRDGKVFLDYFRNSRGATAVAPYSTRARPGAPVSTPIGWAELERVRGDTFDLRNLPRRLGRQRRDPWEGFAQCRQTITKAKMKEIVPERYIRSA